VEAFIWLRARPGSAARIAAQLPGKPGIRRAVIVVGDWDVLALSEGNDLNSIATGILANVHTIDGVERTLTSPVVPPDRLGALGAGFGMTHAPQLNPGEACYIQVRAQPGTVPSLVERLSEVEEISGIAALGGEHDLLLEIRGPWEVASGVVLEHVHPMPGVVSTATLVGVDYQEPEEDRDQFSAWE
jgi:hypothetical protein